MSPRPHRTGTFRLRVAALALPLLFASACERPPADGPAEGAFLVLLGTDTVAAERYALSPEGMEVLAVTRSPRALHREAVLEFDADGGVSRYETRTLDPAAPGDPPLQQSVVTYGTDSVTVVAEPDGEPRRVAGTPRMVPLSFNHFALAELAIRRAVDDDAEELQLWFNGPVDMTLRRPAPDSAALDTGILGTWTARVDEGGRIQEMEAGDLGRRVIRVPGLDVDALARRWAEQDARGEGMGPLSPRDTLTATVAGATLTVDYSRPSARGRQVFGGLVPWGQVWRTGADRATHLSTDRELQIAGHTVPPGTYTVFTIPDREAWTLILNRQTDQAGTEYDPDRDLLRVDLEVQVQDPPMERFTISVEPEGDGGVLRLRWAEVDAHLPFRVPETSGG